jgi:aerobic-type carbon monoxide dehydrogenase small subunit (CoxS/CutS family)
VATFVVNGEEVSVEIPDDVPLLWVLREELGLTGTKFGCGKALCGACTVHVDGRARRSCVLGVGDVEGSLITTIEGLATEELHIVQRAWVDENVPQCGYCQSGQIMSVVAMLEANASPSTADIEAVMSANICRCGTYPRIRRAIARAVAANAAREREEEHSEEAEAIERESAARGGPDGST